MSGNMMLTIAALVLLTTFILSSNKIIVQNKKLDYESEYIITAIGLGQSIIDEAKEKAFDEIAVSGSAVTIAKLTACSNLGAESGEIITSLPDKTTGSINYQSFSKFDDIDDYNNYTRIVTTPRAGNYTIKAQVKYVDQMNPESIASTPTFSKKMTVMVSSPYFDNNVVLNYVFTY
jgi:hypothetical protein